MQDSPGDRFWTPGLIVGVLVACILIAVTAGVAAAGLAIGACGGDGGSPYAAPGSPRGKVCDNGVVAASLIGPGLALMFGVPVASVLRRRLGLAIALGIAFVLAILPAIVVGALPKECAGDDPDIPNTEEFGGNYDCYHY